MKKAMYRLVVASGLFAIFGCGSKSTYPTSNTVAVRSAASIGVAGGHLVDANGFALYDTQSACTGSCLTVWPPMTASQAPAATGGASQAAIALSAGQVTYNGHLLYYFESDTAPGQVSGSGVNGFSLVTP
jgi:predicted lipoprotein with Yx(FWY)xxD motif